MTTPSPNEMSSGPELRSLDRQQALALLFPEELAERAELLRDALRASRAPTLTLAQGSPASLMRTYSARLARAREDKVPALGIEPFLEQLEARGERPVWGFTVRDSAMVFLAFADERVSSLIGIVIVARHAGDSLLMS